MPEEGFRGRTQETAVLACISRVCGKCAVLTMNAERASVFATYSEHAISEGPGARRNSAKQECSYKTGGLAIKYRRRVPRTTIVNWRSKMCARRISRLSLESEAHSA